MPKTSNAKEEDLASKLIVGIKLNAIWQISTNERYGLYGKLIKAYPCFEMRY